jgi:hypothetical protein
MNILKNMEFIFIIALALTCVTAFAAAPVAHKSAPVAQLDAPMATVVITGKRMSAAEKAAFHATGA